MRRLLSRVQHNIQYETVLRAMLHPKQLSSKNAAHHHKLSLCSGYVHPVLLPPCLSC